jgi:endonuclease YncB( thermonuclease family)
MLFGASSMPALAVLVGAPRVVDGDTLEVTTHKKHHIGFKKYLQGSPPYSVYLEAENISRRISHHFNWLAYLHSWKSILNVEFCKGWYAQVAGTRIRLFGMDAPESKQLCKTSKGKDYSCGESFGLEQDRLALIG